MSEDPPLHALIPSCSHIWSLARTTALAVARLRRDVALLQVKEEAGKAFGPDDATPSRAAADAMTYTLSALQACLLEATKHDCHCQQAVCATAEPVL